MAFYPPPTPPTPSPVVYKNFSLSKAKPLVLSGSTVDQDVYNLYVATYNLGLTPKSPNILPFVRFGASRSLQTIRDTLLAGDGQCPPEVMSKVLHDHLHYLEQCLDVYDNKRLKAPEKEKPIAGVETSTLLENPNELSDYLDLDKDESIHLVDSFKAEHKQWAELDNEQLKCDIIMHYFDERLSILQIVCQLFRLCSNEESIYYDVAKEIVERFRWDSFADRIYQQLKSHLTRGIPATFKTLDPQIWTIQSLREQNGCLEILFLIYFTDRPCSPKRIFEFLKHFSQTKFGLDQPTQFVFDNNMANELLIHLNHLAQIFMITILREPDFNISALIEAPKETRLLQSPSTIMEINELALDMNEDLSHGIFFLSWSSYLQHLQQLFEELEVPEAYGDVESILTDSSLTHGNKALASNAFAYILELFKGPCLQPDNANFSGYTASIRDLFISILEAFDPWLLPIRSYEMFVEAFAELHRMGDGYSTLFWLEYQHKSRSSLLLETVRSRFPQQFRPFMQLMTALSSEEESTLNTFYYLQSMNTCTTSFPSDPQSISPEENGQVQALKPIELFGKDFNEKPFVIPPGAIGDLGSKPDGSQIIRWQFEYSAWHLFAAMLESFSQSTIRTFPDDFLLSRDTKISMIFDILNFMKASLKNNISIPVYLEAHLKSLGSFDCLNILYKVLLYISNVIPAPIDMIGACLECFSVFVRDHPHDTYYYFSSTKLISREPTFEQPLHRFHSDGHLQYLLMNFECAAGRYPVTIAFMNFIIEIISKAHQFPIEDNQDLEKMQTDILNYCISYIASSIFMFHDKWRYVNIEDRYLITAKALEIFNRVIIRSPYPTEIPKFNDPILDPGHNSIGTIQKALTSRFLYDGGLHQIVPLLSIIERGKELIKSYERIGSFRIMEEVKRTLELALVFISRLLKIRKISNDSVSLLEHTLMEKTGGGNENQGYIYIIASYIKTSWNIEVPTVATEILTLLMIAAVELNPQLPPLWGYFGNKSEAKDLEKIFINCLKSKGAILLQRAILNFLALSADSHAGLFVADDEALTISIDLKGKGKANETTKSPATETSSNNTKKTAQTDSSTSNTFTKSEHSDSIVRIVLDMVKDWESIQKSTPILLLGALSFLNSIWKNGLFYNALWSQLRKDGKFWASLSGILFSNLKIPLEKWSGFSPAADRFVSNINDSVQQAYFHISIKAYIFTIISQEINLSFQALTEEKDPGKTKNSIEALPSIGLQIILANIKDNNRLSLWLENFTQIDYDPEVDKRCLEITDVIPTFRIEELRVLNWHEDFDITRKYGDDYLYDIAVTYKLSSAMGVEEGHLHDILTRLCQSSHNWSRTDAQVVLFRSWKEFLEVSCDQLGNIFWDSKTNKEIKWDTMERLTELIAYEKRVGLVIRTIRNDMASLLLSLLEHSPVANQHDGNIRYVQLVINLFKAITNDVDSVEESIRGKIKPAFHRPLLHSLLFCLHGIVNSTKGSLPKNSNVFWEFRDTCHRLLSRISTILNTYDLKKLDEEDVFIMIAMLERLIHPNCIPDNKTWVPIIEHCNIIPMLLNIFVNSVSLPRKDRPKYAEANINMFLLLAKYSLSASKLEFHGIISVFLNHSLSSTLRDGLLRPEISSDQHEIWCFMLAVVTRMLSTIGHNEKFLRSVVGFINFYGKQIQKALTCEAPITMGLLEEVERTTMLFYQLSLHIKPDGTIDLTEAAPYYENCLKLLSKVNHLFTHPKTASKIIVPWSREEKQLAEQSFTKEIYTAIENIDASSDEKEMNLFLQRAQQKLFSIARNILATCVVLTQAEDILANSSIATLDPLLTFDSSSKSGEKIPATIQTLLELAGYGFTLLKLWKECITLKESADLASWRVIWKKTPIFLETIFVLIVTQLVLATNIATDDSAIQDIMLQAADVKRHLTRVADIIKELKDKQGNATPAGTELKSLDIVLRGLDRFMSAQLPNGRMLIG
ncbi:hypothetical protein G9A89_012296 [Geosiphon pyriformis]|nr:hypothetical protein G9A89_012296 [Geosiphon pyriformis]